MSTETVCIIAVSAISVAFLVSQMVVWLVISPFIGKMTDIITVLSESLIKSTCSKSSPKTNIDHPPIKSTIGASVAGHDLDPKCPKCGQDGLITSANINDKGTSAYSARCPEGHEWLFNA